MGLFLSINQFTSTVARLTLCLLLTEITAAARVRATNRDVNREPEENIADGRSRRKPILTCRVLEAVLRLLNTGAQ